MTRLTSLPLLLLLSGALATAQPAAPTPGAPPAAGGEAVLDVMFRPNSKFFPLNGPVEVGVIIENKGAAPFDTKGVSLDADLVVKDRAGRLLEKKGALEKEGAPMPATLAPKDKGIRTIDLRAAFPDLATPGCYRVEWKNPRVRSRGPEIRIAPPYDGSRDYVATLHTSKGDVTVELAREKAPNHVFNFVQLASAGFYDGLTFHRVKPGVLIQGGDPKGDGTGNSGYMVKAEPNDLKHERGSFVMARGSDPNSGSCQFYITLSPQPEWDGKYTVFGKVTAGMETVEAIAKVQVGPGDRPVEPVVISSITVAPKDGAAPAAPATPTTPAATPATPATKDPATPKSGS